MAASFVNLLQFNNAVLLVGESLWHNALHFGEVIPVNHAFSRLGVSTMQMTEFSNEIGGILKPDIEIPYKVSDYVDGSDYMLEKLLAYISHNNIKPYLWRKY